MKKDEKFKFYPLGEGGWGDNLIILGSSILTRMQNAISRPSKNADQR